MMPWWVRREDLDGEICSIMETSDLEVYHDGPHNCLHIMRGGAEFTSCLYPLDDQIRDELRHAAFLLHNGIDEEERQRIKDANEKMEAYGESVKEEAKDDWRDEALFEYKNRFIGPANTPMVIVPGGE